MTSKLLAAAFLMAGQCHVLASGSPVLSDFVSLKSAIEMYRQTTGELPSPDAGFGALVERPQALSLEKKWVRIMTLVPSDPWGQPYGYLMGDGFPAGFGIYCTGRDGKSASQGNDADDYNTWSSDHRGIETDLRKSLPWLWPSVVVACLASFWLGARIAGRRNASR